MFCRDKHLCLWSAAPDHILKVKKWSNAYWFRTTWLSGDLHLSPEDGSEGQVPGVCGDVGGG